MEPNDTFTDINMHQVRRVAEVRKQIVNDLLEQGWILHDIYINSEYRSTYILLCLDEITCPRCGAIASIEINEEGDRYRYICANECN